MANIVLVIGGVRSGKSRFAQQLAYRLGGSDVLFVATAESHDGEMSRRIQIHRASRPAEWKTLEVPEGVGIALGLESSQTVLIDCLTLLISNLLLKGGDRPDPQVTEQIVNQEIESLLAACEQRQGTVVIVTGEVGLGIVPESYLGRLFRDLLGWANQTLAARSTTTYLMVAGIPIELKSLATTVEQAAVQCESGELGPFHRAHAAVVQPHDHPHH